MINSTNSVDFGTATDLSGTVNSSGSIAVQCTSGLPY